jgi:glycosyltransferase involved in cell wall biosynthesis
MTAAVSSRRSMARTIPRARWIHLCNGLDPRRDGGMVPSILGMAGALAASGESVAIVSPTPSRLDGTPLPPPLPLHGPEADLEGAVRSAEVVHLHGLWQGHTRRGARAALRAGIPYLIAAHGMADPWALRQKRLKKSIYTFLVEGKNLRRASCLHALTRPEVDHFRALAPRTPVCLVPNGVDLEPLENLPSRAELEREHPELAGKFVLLFLARLHVKKGLDLLAPALAEVARERPDLHLLLAGPDDGALGPFQQQIQALGIGHRVTYLGHVAGDRARRAWGAADAFVLPSRSEGFSMAVLEALACSLPALLTAACHFPEAAVEGAGLVVPPTVDGIALGLRGLLERSATERAAMGERGRTLVASRYTWDRQGERLAAVYRWLVGGGPRPEAVVD